MSNLTVLEICAGAGGQSSGLEAAGFEHVAAIDNDADACATLRMNRPDWHVLQGDVADIAGAAYEGVDLFAGGVPCPPFSIAGQQLGAADERDLFPHALRLIREIKPRAIMLENVRGLASRRFTAYRESILSDLSALGYTPGWQLLHASNFGVPQLRPRFILVALRPEDAPHFFWPEPQSAPATVGDVLQDLMSARGWAGAQNWAARANRIAPTIVGGSKKHGGPDLGPTRARREWLSLGVDGKGLADEAPGRTDLPDLTPRLTLRMVARLQGFDDAWQFSGKKTAAYRQVGNAFPPPVAASVAKAIRSALNNEHRPRSAPAKSVPLAGQLVMA